MTDERVAGVGRLRRRPGRARAGDLPLDAGRAEPVLGKLQLLVNRRFARQPLTRKPFVAGSQRIGRARLPFGRLDL